MMFRFLSILALGTIVCSCIQQPVYTTGVGAAKVRSHFPMTRLNSKPLESSFDLDIQTGINSVEVQMKTLMETYSCHFEWYALPNTTYEIIRDKQRQPLTMFVWKRENPFWASRTDPIDAKSCRRLDN